MPKRIAYTHEVKVLPDESGVYDVYLPTADEICPPFLISLGLVSGPADYFNLARRITLEGAAAIIPNTNVPQANELSTDPMVWRPNVLRAVMDAAAGEYGWDSFCLAGDSFGGAYQTALLKSAGHEIATVDFINAVGFEKFNDFRRLMRFGWNESRGAIAKVALGAIKHPSRIPGHLHVPRIVLDCRAILALEEGYNLPYIELAQRAGIVSRTIVSLHDPLISAEETRRVAAPVIGDENVIFMEEGAGHLAVRNQASRVARILVRRERLSSAA